MSLPKPDGFKFPQGGWLRGTDKAVMMWLLQTDSADGAFSEELAAISSTLEKDGSFEPRDSDDVRTRILRAIVQRRSQPQFRMAMLDAYDGKCAVTGCDIVQALEAAHISPYNGEKSNHVTNGLLLRADLHTLLDLRLIGIEPETLKVHLSGSLLGTSAEELNGKMLKLPTASNQRPSLGSLKESWEAFQESMHVK